jgi:hypothetical protein
LDEIFPRIPCVKASIALSSETSSADFFYYTPALYVWTECLPWFLGCKLWVLWLMLAFCKLTWNCLWIAWWVHPSSRLFIFVASWWWRSWSSTSASVPRTIVMAWWLVFVRWSRPRDDAVLRLLILAYLLLALVLAVLLYAYALIGPTVLVVWWTSKLVLLRVPLRVSWV